MEERDIGSVLLPLDLDGNHLLGKKEIETHPRLRKLDFFETLVSRKDGFQENPRP